MTEFINVNGLFYFRFQYACNLKFSLHKNNYNNIIYLYKLIYILLQLI